MASEILKNASNGTFVFHATTNATLIIAGNNSVSNVAINDEEVSGAHIKHIWSGSSSGGGNNYWEVLRGANLVAVMDSTAFIDFEGNGFGLNKDSAANLTVQYVGGGSAYIMIELKKHLGN